MEYSQAQAAMQLAYLNQVQEVTAHLSQEEARYQGAIHQQNQAHEAQLSQLRRVLLQAQNNAERQPKSCENRSVMLQEFTRKNANLPRELYHPSRTLASSLRARHS